MTDREYGFICSPLSPVLPTSYTAEPHTDEEIAAERFRIFEENRAKAEQLARYIALEFNVIPMAPHAYFTRFFDDTDANERAIGMSMGRDWLKLCKKVFVVGGTVTRGMADELADAYHMGLEIIPMDEPTRKAVDAYVATLVDHFGG